MPDSQGGQTWEVLGAVSAASRRRKKDLDFGDSGTGVRLMLGVIAGHDCRAHDGRCLAVQAPDGPGLGAVESDGAGGAGQRQGDAAAHDRGSADLVPIEYQLPVASAQIKSAVLIAGLHAAGETTVIEPAATRDHTERMLSHFGAQVTATKRQGLRAVSGHRATPSRRPRCCSSRRSETPPPSWRPLR